MIKTVKLRKANEHRVYFSGTCAGHFIFDGSNKDWAFISDVEWYEFTASDLRQIADKLDSLNRTEDVEGE